MRDDLVAEYIGQTAPKTKRVLDAAMGGVLFIDEAYYLYRAGDSKDYGQEVIDILLQVMENERDKLVVILAGVQGPDGRVLRVKSRDELTDAAHHLDFAAYELMQLVHIGRRMMERSNYSPLSGKRRRPSASTSSTGWAAWFAYARTCATSWSVPGSAMRTARDRPASASLEPGRSDAPRARGCRHPGVTAGPLPRRAAWPPRGPGRPRAIRSPTESPHVGEGSGPPPGRRHSLGRFAARRPSPATSSGGTSPGGGRLIG